jgi:hypothetical protein
MREVDGHSNSVEALAGLDKFPHSSEVRTLEDHRKDFIGKIQDIRSESPIPS